MIKDSSDLSKAPDRSEIERIIEFEIQLISEEQRRRGWDRWILLVAISTVVWLALSELSASNLDISGGVRLWAILVFLSFLIREIRKLIDHQNVDDSRPARLFLFSDRIGKTRFALSISILVVSMAFLLIFHDRPRPWNLGNFLFLLFPAFWPASGWLALALSFFGIPTGTPTIPRKRLYYILDIILIALASYWAVAEYHIYSKTYSLHSVGVWKAALLLGAFFELLKMLVLESPHDSSLETLTSLKRQLMLKTEETAEIWSKLEMTLFGMRAEHFLKDEIISYISVMDKAEAALNEAHSQQEGVLVILQKHPNEHNPDDARLVDTRMTSAETLLGDALQFQKTALKAATRINNRCVLLVGVAGCAEDIARIKSQLRDALARVDSRRARCKAKIDELRKSVQGSYPNEVKL